MRCEEYGRCRKYSVKTIKNTKAGAVNARLLYFSDRNKRKKILIMKKLHCLFMVICLALMPSLQSCGDSEGYSVGDFTPPLWATVRVTGNAFYLNCDRWGTLWPVNVDLGWYEAVDGQRVLTVFNPLWDNYEGYDHAVKLLKLQNVLTKGVETLIPETGQEFGNDPVRIYKGDISISGGYMNIFFVQNLPSAKKHRISLVRPQKDEDLYADDGYIHLELRYNDYDDLTGRRSYAAVSYNLNSLKITHDIKGFKLKLHSEVNGKVEIAFDLKSSTSNIKEINIPDLSDMQLQ